MNITELQKQMEQYLYNISPVIMEPRDLECVKEKLQLHLLEVSNANNIKLTEHDAEKIIKGLTGDY